TAAASDLLRIAGELTSVKGYFADAAEAVVGAAKIEALIGNALGNKGNAEGSGYSLWRAAELKQVAMDKAAGDKLLGEMFASISLSGGKLSASDWFTFASRAGPTWILAD